MDSELTALQLRALRWLDAHREVFVRIPDDLLPTMEEMAHQPKAARLVKMEDLGDDIRLSLTAAGDEAVRALAPQKTGLFRSIF